MTEIKERSVVDMKIDELLNVASVLEKFKGWIEPQDYFSVENSRVTLWPDSEDASRRYVGALMRIFKAKPRMEKSGTTLIAYFNYNGVEIKVWNYKTKKCRLIKKTVQHEAEPEKIVPAKAAWTEEVEELVCEMPSVQQEIDATDPAGEPVTPAPEEVPF